jgi:hypothetical protein
VSGPVVRKAMSFHGSQENGWYLSGQALLTRLFFFPLSQTPFCCLPWPLQRFSTACGRSPW